MFSFVFDKKSLTLLLAGLLIAGGLLFFAGLLVGVNQGLPTGTAVAYVRPVPAKQQPCPEPIRPEPAPAPAAPPIEEPAPAPQIAEEEPPPPAPAIEKPEPEPQPQPVLAAYREPEPKPKAEGDFSVQVGAFRSKENSEAVIRELEGRGYQPYVVQRTTSKRRVLHTVRIGRYADRGEALRAAAEFRDREKMSAIVERVGRL